MSQKDNIPLSDEEFNSLFLEATDMLYTLGMKLFAYNQDEAKEFIHDVYLHSINKKKTLMADLNSQAGSIQ